MTTEISTTKNKFVLGNRPELTTLRFPLAFLVLVAHNSASWAFGDWMVLSWWFGLSGFLITTILLTEFDRTGAISLRKFYERRLAKIFPPLLAVFIITAVLGWIVNQGDYNHMVLRDGLFSLVFLEDYRVGLNLFNQKFSMFAHTWTVSVEEQFYLMWSMLVIYFIVKKRNVRGLTIVAIILLIVFTASRITIWEIYHDPRMVYYTFHTRADALMYGCLLAIFLNQGRFTNLTERGLKYLKYLTIICTIAMLYVLAFVQWDTTATYTWAMPVTEFGSVVTILYLVSKPNPKIIKFLQNKILVHCGKVTYSAYLIHWIIIIYTLNYLPKMNLFLLFGIRLILVAISTEILYNIIEMPMRKIRKRKFTPEQLKPDAATL